MAMFTEEEKQQMRDFGSKAMKDFDEKLSYLRDRWEDEKEYEDFKDYIDAVKAFCKEKGYNFVKMTKRPFAVTVRYSYHPEVVLEIRSTSRWIATNWKRG